MSRPPWTPDEWVRVILAVAAGLVLIGLIIDSMLGIRIEDDTAVTAAREVAQQGLDDYEAGEYETAAEKLLSAYQVVKLPTVALHTARALAKVGKLVEASEVYLQATRLDALRMGDVET